MKIIIPMAGRGSRLRPHTLTTPKPLVPIAGKPIVHRLVEDIVALYDGKVEEIGFVIGDFGPEVEQQLLGIASDMGAKGHIFHQEEPLGTAHAIWMAEQLMDGEIIIAFADTLFRANFKLDREKDGAIWVKTVENPASFGVVTIDGDGIINDMVEKPQEFVSDLAIIGIYYLRDGEKLREEIRYLLDNDLKEKGEYQLTNALANMKQKGARFVPGKVDDWMDCGNKAAVLDTTHKILNYESADNVQLVANSATVSNCVIIPPCFIGENAKVYDSVIGPYSVIGNNSSVKNSVISKSIVGENSSVNESVVQDSMIGNHASADGAAGNLDIGDYCSVRKNG